MLELRLGSFGSDIDYKLFLTIPGNGAKNLIVLFLNTTLTATIWVEQVM